MSLTPSTESNETVPFPEQAEFQILTSDGRLCVNLGYQGDWVIEASLDNTTGDPNARLEGMTIYLMFLLIYIFFSFINWMITQESFFNSTIMDIMWQKFK